MTGIDLNTIEALEEEEEEEALAAATPELWHACAGPMISLPKKGSSVVYLTQGHFETLGFSEGFRSNVPAHVFCRVADVKLHADAATDEVFAQLSLVPQCEEVERKLGEGEIEGDEEAEEFNGGNRSSLMPHMFCKTLTASDTSTHGGFSVPRRAAEDCFPPLDYTQQRPSQELVAKDLHGTEWRFRHIYRGQPRRHLLTTGWSAFINKKKLTSGDAVLFLRGSNGELRLGVRRAVQLKSAIPYSGLCTQSMNLGTLAAVADAVSSKTVFHIYYNPRASPSEFIIPLWKFAKSMNYSFSIGTRFKMRFESEDASERRYTGWVAGIGDVDPARWPGSKWKCLLVRWDDDDVDRSRQSRLSPWEIEPTGTVSGSTGLSASGSKRTKFCLPPANPDNPVSNGSGCVDFGESVRFHKVLQGQENFGSKASYGHIGVMSSRITEKQNHQYPEMRRSEFSYKCAGFGESVRFHKVLQGQEIFPENPYAENCVFGSFKGGNSSAGGREPVPIQGYSIFVPPSTPPAQVSSPSSVLTFQQNSQLPCTHSVYGSNTWNNGDNGSYLGYSYFPKFAGELNRKQCEAENSSKQGLKNEQAIGRTSCKLFGFSLTERIPVVDVVDDTFPASPTSTDMNFETSSPSSNPNSVEISCTKVSSLQAVCAATPF